MVAATITDESLFERMTSWENLQAAARKARLGKRRQHEVARFELERERELLRLRDELCVTERTGRGGTGRSMSPSRSRSISPSRASISAMSSSVSGDGRFIQWTIVHVAMTKTTTPSTGGISHSQGCVSMRSYSVGVVAGPPLAAGMGVPHSGHRSSLALRS